MTDISRIVFISGANRGIGYELTLQMANKNHKIVAGYRDEKRSHLLLETAQKTTNIVPFKVDIAIENELKTLYDFIFNKFGYLDILINNAGVKINSSARLNELEWSDIEHNFKVNVGGPFLTAKYLYPLIKKGKGKKIINISSRMGSIKLSRGDETPYRLSKAGLNMLTKNQSVQYGHDGITVVCLHPGWVKTDMGGSAAPITVQESAFKILQIIENISLSNTGEFISFDGNLVPY